MPKGSPCPCGRCHVHVFCEAGATAFGGGGGAGGSAACCKCVPKRLCVAIWPSAEESCNLTAPETDPYGPAIQKTFNLVCDLVEWSGLIRINSVDVDFTFYFERDEDDSCWFVLESLDLGYRNDLAYDTRLRIPVEGGFGPSEDAETRISQCVDANFEFVDVDLSGGVYGCGLVRITTFAADYQPLIEDVADLPPVDPYSCFCDCLCITLVNADGEQFRADACYDEVTKTWHTTFASPYEFVTIHFDEYDPLTDNTIVSLESSLGDGDSIQAECGTCPRKAGMYAEWDFGSYGRVTAICKAGGGCIDCHCWCRCVCLVYNDDDNIIRERLCWDDYTETWHTTLVLGDYTSVPVVFWLVCDTPTGVTHFSMTDPFGGDTVTSVTTCPELTASWTVTKPDYSPATFTLECDTCGRCFDPGEGEQETCGCYTPIPETLYATFSPGTVIPGPPPSPKSCLGATGTIILIFDAQLGSWIGSGTPFAGCETRIYLRLTCSSDVPGDGKMTLEIGTSYATMTEVGEVSITCDPFGASFSSISVLTAATDACCESEDEYGTVDYNIFDITITE